MTGAAAEELGAAPVRPWEDSRLSLDERVTLLIAQMTVEEKVAQLVGVWVGEPADDEPADTAQVAPTQPGYAEALPPWEELIRPGLGQLTRIFGSAPVEPAAGAWALAAAQRDIVAGSRLGIPAIAHEECLTGFATWRATVFPTPLAWAATFDPDTIEAMAAGIGAGMHSVGVHQGLAPVLDVTRDPRWGRTEETLGEDPYLVGLLGAAYARGLESAGVVATLKHFAGYSASTAGRNHAPVGMGRRELLDTVLPPFEMALRLGGARSVMQSYAEIDGVPPAADGWLLTELLRGAWGFRGVVVSDYYGLAFLQTAHRVADSPAAAAALALTAGVDVELPTVDCYGAPLLAGLRDGSVPEALVDRALRRVLRQKAELGLLDADWDPVPPALRSGGSVQLDPPALQALADRVAERSVVLLQNGRGVLPLDRPARLAVLGPCADDPRTLMGGYAFPNHVGPRHPGVPLGIEVPTLLQALRAELPGTVVTHAAGCPVREPDRSGILAAMALAAESDAVVLAIGDQSGLFGRGTSGEGCDATDLQLPGVQQELVEAVLDTGVPVVLVVLSGRPYALGAFADRAAALVQAFLPGQRGAIAVAGVLSGRIAPSGRLPVQIPVDPGGQPARYRHAPTGGRTGVSQLDPTPLFPFGHGLSYTTFSYEEIGVSGTELSTSGVIDVHCVVANTGDRAGTEIVQLYLGERVAPVTLPTRELAGFARVELPPGGRARVTFRLHADRTSFTGTDLHRAVEPGPLTLLVGPSSADPPLRAAVTICGPRRLTGRDRVLTTPIRVELL